ncbi:MAG TPA: KH domain-containing protein, partial [Oculatellaceae cyanobacterium]
MCPQYVAQVDDQVIGIISERLGEQYKVDINGSLPAFLSQFAFEGATKRNKPNLNVHDISLLSLNAWLTRLAFSQVGSLVYARVSVANKDMEPELTCISPIYKKEWTTGQNLLGELSGGYCFDCSLALAQSLLKEDCHVMRLLSSLRFEVSIGQNGRVWVRSDSCQQTIFVASAITQSELLP